MTIVIKPHHFIDIVTAVGGGRREWQPAAYGHAVHTVAKSAVADPDVMLRMEFGADDICAPCCHNVDGVCDDTINTEQLPGAPESKGEYNLMLDKRWSERLGLREGDELTARAFCGRVRERAGDISELYLETPAERIAERKEKLAQGVAFFVDQAPAEPQPEDE